MENTKAGPKVSDLIRAFLDESTRNSLLIGKWLEFQRNGQPFRALIGQVLKDAEGQFARVVFSEGTGRAHLTKDFQIEGPEFLAHVFAGRDATKSLLVEANEADREADRQLQNSAETPTSFDTVENITNRILTRSRQVLSILKTDFPELSGILTSYFDQAELAVRVLMADSEVDEKKSQLSVFERAKTDKSSRLKKSIAKAKMSSTEQLKRLRRVKNLLNDTDGEIQTLSSILKLNSPNSASVESQPML